MYSLYLIHWNEQEAATHAKALSDLGYRVDSAPFHPEVFRKLRQDPPDMMLIDLSRKPSVGRDVALMIRSYKQTRHISIVFTEGQPAKVQAIKDLLPDAIYTDWQHIREALVDAIENPPVSPVVPKSVMAPYSGSPLPKKLGIKASSRVTLINPPPDFSETLGPLPKDVLLQSPNDLPGDVVLWFIMSGPELAELEETAQLYGDKKLWICWRKQSSGSKGDVNSNSIRAAALEYGLVDYKICSIDKTWSGMLFARKK